MILQGEIGPHERLYEPALSELIGISRTPLRAAIGELLHEGLIERVSSGGARVPRYTPQDIFDTIEVRGTLEGLAARMAAERGPGASELELGRAILAALDEAIGQGGDQIDFADYVTHNGAFHDWIATAAGSPIVMRELERARRRPLAGPSTFLQGQELSERFRASLTVAQAQHVAIFEAVEAREGSRAEAVCREHARLARRNLQDALDRKDTQAARIPGLSLVSQTTN